MIGVKRPMAQKKVVELAREDVGSVLTLEHKENIALGDFVRRYFSTPVSQNVQERSSLREDTVIHQVTSLLDKVKKGPIHLIDVCCGHASLAWRIIESEPKRVGRICYYAVDQDPGCMEAITGIDAFRKFKAFELIQRLAWDLDRQKVKAPADLIVLNNALHEIPPHKYPDLFTTFNSLLQLGRGRVCVVDMESLPLEASESIAIPWSKPEIQAFLGAAGLRPSVSRHKKEGTTVCQAHFGHASQGIKGRAMIESLQALLKKRLTEAIVARQRVGARLRQESCYSEYVVSTGAVARYVDEINALEEWLRLETDTSQ
jgi:hypothetical protein